MAGGGAGGTGVCGGFFCGNDYIAYICRIINHLIFIEMKSTVKNLVIVAAILLTVGVSGAQAQKGVMAGGLNYALAFNTDGSLSGIAPKVQYYLSKHFRGEADATFFFPKNKVGYLDLSVYGHYLFDLSERASVFPSLGVGLLTSSTTGLTDRKISTWPAVSFGGGIEYALFDNLSVNAELKYKAISGDGSSDYGWLTIGVAYKFKGL